MPQLSTRNRIFDRLLADFEGNVLPLDSQVVRSMRLKTLIQGMRDEVTLMATPLYDGEEQIYLFQDIYDQARKVWTSTRSKQYVPGSISSYFLTKSVRYALLARYLSLGSFKAMSDQVQADLIANSEIHLIMSAYSPVKIKTDPGKDFRASDAVTALHKIMLRRSDEGDNSLPPLADFGSPASLTESQATAELSETGKLYSQLLTFLGTSRGIPLTAQSRAVRVVEFNTVLDAIAYLGDDDGATRFLSRDTFGEDNALSADAIPLMQLDAWTLASAMRLYLKWISSPESPWMAIPPPSSPLTAAQNLKRHANYLSIINASVATSYLSGEIELAIFAYENTVKIWDPLISTRPAASSDLADRLKSIKSRFLSPDEFISTFNRAALNSMSTYLSVTHWVLPSDDTLAELRSQVMEKLPSQAEISDFDGLSKLMSKSVTLSYTHRERMLVSLDAFLDTLEAAVALYSASNRLHEKLLLDNLGISGSYILTGADVPPAPEVKPVAQIQYADLMSTSPMVSVMPRFAPRVSVAEDVRWILKDALYKPHYRAMLNLEKVDVDARFVWPMKGSVAMGETVTTPYLRLPIPAAYTAQVDSEIHPYGLPSFTALISGYTEGISSKEYLRNFCDIIAATSDEWLNLLMNAISGAFVVQRKQSGKWTTLYPDLPTVYGAPARMLIDINVEATENVWHTVKSASGEYRFKAYTWLPKPGPAFAIPYQWTRGAYINVPLIIYFADPAYMKDANSLKDTNYETVRSNIATAQLKESPENSTLLVKSLGWSNYVTALPHVLFRVAEPYAASFSPREDLLEAALVRTSFKREADLGLLTFRAVFADEVFVLDSDDEMKGITGSPEAPSEGPSPTDAAPGIGGEERKGARPLGGPDVTNAPAAIEPIITDPSKPGAIAGPGKSDVLGAAPLPDSAAAVLAANEEKGTAPVITVTGGDAPSPIVKQSSASPEEHDKLIAGHGSPNPDLAALTDDQLVTIIDETTDEKVKKAAQKELDKRKKQAASPKSEEDIQE